MKFAMTIRAMMGTLVVASCAITNAPAEDHVNRRALFGELHIHTRWSFDAYMMSTRATPDDAYEFAKGKPLKHPLGQTYQINRPLDFMAVTDHAEFLGVLSRADDPNHPMSKLPVAKRIFDENGKVRDGMGGLWGAMARREQIEGITTAKDKLEAWQYVVDAANRHNDPGNFTAFVAYEWSTSKEGRNLHRNVIFKGDSGPVPFTRFDSTNPEDLWAWMEDIRASGNDVLAIPHNANLSDGSMFPRLDSSGQPLTANYAATRNRNEPLVEVSQIKGTSETHPMLSPNDEFADFEIVEYYVANLNPVTKFSGGYVRDAYRTGLEFQDTQGFNPYRFGLVAASDSHTGITSIVESDYCGPAGAHDGTPVKRLSKNSYPKNRKFSASGIAGVWANENTRASIFDALRRKETWGTTGPRIQVRFFGGFDMAEITPDREQWVDAAYKKGVPMGGSLPATDNSVAPTFLMYAIKDVDSANLDRIQIVKGWSEDGVSHERVFDAVWSGDRSLDPASGKLPPVGNTVNPKTLQYSNTIGAVELKGTWTDPEFNPAEDAFYYVRTLEIPTPRWSSFDAKVLGIPIPDGVPHTIQERAYTSPIWYDAR